jgi:hypothetical protein
VLVPGSRKNSANIIFETVKPIAALIPFAQTAASIAIQPVT